MFEKYKKVDGGEVIVVGTGIGGLMEAFVLLQCGYSPIIFSKGPDPRDDFDVEHYSSTCNGELGRFVTRFEGEPYLGDTKMYPNMKGAFQKHVLEGGWLGLRDEDMSREDKIWLQKRTNACDQVEQIKECERMYVKDNGISMCIWQRMISTFPELFKDTDLSNEGVVRFYDNKSLFEWAIKRHRKEKVLDRVLLEKEILDDYPDFIESYKQGMLAGGIEVPGFSINVHAFVKNLIDFLETHKVPFNWNTEIESIEKNKRNEVMCLVSGKARLTARYYSINIGAYGNLDLLKGTPAEGSMGGVAGRWLIMPRPVHLEKPVKIHGDVRVERGVDYPVVDVNLTPFNDVKGNRWMAVGGGYAYVGNPPFESKNFREAFELIDNENERTIKTFLGPTYRKAIKEDMVKRSEKVCFRSFTYDDFPLDVNLKTEQGGMLRINGGTNTGTFTISPVQAIKTVKVFNKAG